MVDIVFAHGWGSGTFVWDKMLPAFSNHSCHVINMGFLGETNLKIPEGKFLGIGHSLGGLWLLKHYPDQMIGFVSIASFNCFYKHIPTQILSMMKRNVVKDVNAQLKDFWHYAGLDHPGGFKNLNPPKLIEGLGWLSKWKSDIPNIPAIALASRNDHIVPMQMTLDIWDQYNLHWIDEGGHMLPLTQPDWCIHHVKEFINAIG